MRLAVRVSLVVLGLAAALYGSASLTGGWLGTPPWWEREQEATDYERVLAAYEELKSQRDYEVTVLMSPEAIRRGRELVDRLQGPAAMLDREPLPIRHPSPPTAAEPIRRHFEAVPAREIYSGVAVAAGLALAIVGAWPRRRTPSPAT